MTHTYTHMHKGTLYPEYKRGKRKKKCDKLQSYKSVQCNKKMHKQKRQKTELFVDLTFASK